MIAYCERQDEGPRSFGIECLRDKLGSSGSLVEGRRQAARTRGTLRTPAPASPNRGRRSASRTRAGRVSGSPRRLPGRKSEPSSAERRNPSSMRTGGTPRIRAALVDPAASRGAQPIRARRAPPRRPQQRRSGRPVGSASRKNRRSAAGFTRHTDAGRDLCVQRPPCAQWAATQFPLVSTAGFAFTPITRGMVDRG